MLSHADTIAIVMVLLAELLDVCDVDAAEVLDSLEVCPVEQPGSMDTAKTIANKALNILLSFFFIK
jgi:hypothetical protein